MVSKVRYFQSSLYVIPVSFLFFVVNLLSFFFSILHCLGFLMLFFLVNSFLFFFIYPFYCFTAISPSFIFYSSFYSVLSHFFIIILLLLLVQFQFSFYSHPFFPSQLPLPQSLIIERLHSGARHHVILDFGSVVEITDIIIPSCSDLSSLSIDAWLEGEEKDAKRVAIVSDIGSCGCVLKDLHPPPVCQFVKVRHNM